MEALHRLSFILAIIIQIYNGLSHRVYKEREVSDELNELEQGSIFKSDQEDACGYYESARIKSADMNTKDTYSTGKQIYTHSDDTNYIKELSTRFEDIYTVTQHTKHRSLKDEYLIQKLYKKITTTTFPTTKVTTTKELDPDTTNTVAKQARTRDHKDELMIEELYRKIVTYEFLTHKFATTEKLMKLAESRPPVITRSSTKSSDFSTAQTPSRKIVTINSSTQKFKTTEELKKLAESRPPVITKSSTKYVSTDFSTARTPTKMNHKDELIIEELDRKIVTIDYLTYKFATTEKLMKLAESRPPVITRSSTISSDFSTAQTPSRKIVTINSSTQKFKTTEELKKLAGSRPPVITKSSTKYVSTDFSTARTQTKIEVATFPAILEDLIKIPKVEQQGTFENPIFSISQILMKVAEAENAGKATKKDKDKFEKKSLLTKLKQFLKISGVADSKFQISNAAGS